MTQLETIGLLALFLVLGVAFMVVVGLALEAVRRKLWDWVSGSRNTPELEPGQERK